MKSIIIKCDFLKHIININAIRKMKFFKKKHIAISFALHK